MKVLCVAQLEDRELADGQVLKQTRQPDRTIFYIDKHPAKGIDARRARIAENHQHLREFVMAYKPDIVWQIEGDSVIPEDALEKLLAHYEKQPGIYSGIQVGRHGLYCLGAWHVSQYLWEMSSVDYQLKGLQHVDAMGMYCFIAPALTWLYGQCKWSGQYWGPDVNFFLSMPGSKYVDMDLHIGHQIKRGIISPSDMSTCNARFFVDPVTNEWRFEQL